VNISFVMEFIQERLEEIYILDRMLQLYAKYCILMNVGQVMYRGLRSNFPGGLHRQYYRCRY
jgi:hypothetical protein